MGPKPTDKTDMPENSPDWVLPEALRHLAAEGEAELVGELLGDFRADVAARMLKLRAAVARRDPVVVKAEAHSIKGSAAQMGAAGMAEACLALEMDTRAGSLENADSQIETIQTQFDRVCGAMAQHPLCPK